MPIRIIRNYIDANDIKHKFVVLFESPRESNQILGYAYFDNVPTDSELYELQNVPIGEYLYSEYIQDNMGQINLDNTIILTSITTVPDARGTGISILMLCAGAEEAMMEGYQWIALYRTGVSWLKQYYETFGFVDTGFKRAMYASVNSVLHSTRCMPNHKT